MTEQRPLTFGEKAVGLAFNPSGDPKVQAAKEAFAALIDAMNDFRNTVSNTSGNTPGVSREAARLASVAITELQGAQMWAVKALTWRD